jgi:hypothetical protein
MGKNFHIHISAVCKPRQSLLIQNAQRTTNLNICTFKPHNSDAEGLGTTEDINAKYSWEVTHVNTTEFPEEC